VVAAQANEFGVVPVRGFGFCVVALFRNQASLFRPRTIVAGVVAPASALARLLGCR